MGTVRTPREHTGALKCERDARGLLLPIDALLRFKEKCRFEPETGCVVWIGGTTMGRGHHVPYPSFWFDGRRWFGHRWAAKHIHGLDIDGFQIDHCCPNVPIPNTLCVQHLQAITPRVNRELQTHRRRTFVHLQVGLLQYEEVYGPQPELTDDYIVPYYTIPNWLKGDSYDTDDDAGCPF